MYNKIIVQQPIKRKQTTQTKIATVVQPGIDNANAEITTDNTVTGIPTKIENKDNNRLDITDQKIVTTAQSKPKVSKNELVLDNTIVDQDKDIAVSQPGKKNDEIQQAPVSFQPGEKISQK